MKENNQAAKTLITAFVSEATLAADMVLFEIKELEVPDEIVESAKLIFTPGKSTVSLSKTFPAYPAIMLRPGF